MSPQDEELKRKQKQKEQEEKYFTEEDIIEMKSGFRDRSF